MESRCCYVICDRNSFFTYGKKQDVFYLDTADEYNYDTTCPYKILCGMQVVDNSNYCKFHKCQSETHCVESVYFDDMTKIKSKLCRDHLCHSCKWEQCQNECCENSKFCKEHKCSECVSEKVIGELCDTCMKSKAVKCDYDECQNFVKFEKAHENFCAEHKCKKCNENKVAKNAEYCCKCKCHLSVCVKVRQENKPYCEEHTKKCCNFFIRYEKNCEEQKMDGFNYCKKHKCLIKICDKKICKVYDSDCEKYIWTSYCQEHNRLYDFLCKFGINLDEFDGKIDLNKDEIELKKAIKLK